MKLKKLIAEKRILAIVLLLSAIGILASILSFRGSIRQVEIDSFKETLMIHTQHKLITTRNLINEMVDDLTDTAKILSEVEDLHDQKVKDILKISNKMNWFDYTCVADTEGNSFDYTGLRVNVADREYFKTAMEGNIAFSNVMLSKFHEGRSIQVYACPIRAKNQEIKGVVFGVLNLEKLEKINVQKSDNIGNGTYKKGYTYIVDEDGDYISRFEDHEAIISESNFWDDIGDSTFLDIDLPTLKANFDAQKKGDFSYIDGGAKRYACYMPIGVKNWQLVYIVEDTVSNAALQGLYHVDTKNTIFAGICNLLMLLCVALGYRSANRELVEAHNEANKNVELMRIASEHSQHIIFEYDQQNCVINLKSNIYNLLFNQPVITSVPESFLSTNLICADSVRELLRLFEEIKTRESSEADIQINSEREEVWYRVSMYNIYDEHKDIFDTVGVVADITEEKYEERSVMSKLEIQDTLISNALLYAKVDLSTGQLLEINGEELSRPYSEFLEKYIIEYVNDEDRAHIASELSLMALNTACAEGKDAVVLEFAMRFDDATKWVSCAVRRIHMNDCPKAVIVITDIDDKKREEIALKERAERDGLTGLYNTATMRTKINEVLAEKHNPEEILTFILFDLDNYKQINDTFGHTCGDQVLIDVANILSCRFRSSDIIGRLGGDEFAILLRNMNACECMDRLIEELRQSLNMTYSRDGKQVTLSASIGIAMAPKDGRTFQELYKKSDIALYQVKNNGKNGYKRYN